MFGHGAHINHGVEVIRAAAVCHCVGQLVFHWEQTRHAQDGMLLRLLLREGKVAHAGFVCVSRDEHNDAYLCSPHEREGLRQIAELREQSSGVSLELAGEKVVVRVPLSAAKL